MKLQQQAFEWLLEPAQDDQTYREVYNYAYDFSREPGQKCVQLETALAMWQLVFSVRPWKLLPAWCSFLSEHHRRAISKDTWVQLLDFAWVSAHEPTGLFNFCSSPSHTECC